VVYSDERTFDLRLHQDPTRVLAHTSGFELLESQVASIVYMLSDDHIVQTGHVTPLPERLGYVDYAEVSVICRSDAAYLMQAVVSLNLNFVSVL